MAITTNPMTFAHAEEATRILTVSALFSYLVNDESGCETETRKLRTAVDIATAHAESPELLQVFDDAIRVETERMETQLAPSMDNVDDMTRKMQAWRTAKYLTALARKFSDAGDADSSQSLLYAATYLQDFWCGDEPITAWYSVESLMMV